MGRVRVIGLGNMLAGDDAVGLIAARQLRDLLPADVEVQAREVPDWDDLQGLSGDDVVIFIDAVDSGAMPGTIFEFNLGDVIGAGLRHCSSHGLGLEHWASVAEALGEHVSHLMILGMEIASAELGDGVSEPVTAALPELLQRVEQAVAKARDEGWNGKGSHA